MNELIEEGTAIGMVGEQTMGNPAFLASDCVCDASVEVLDHAVGSRSRWLGEAVFDAGLGVRPIERMIAGGFALRLAGHVHGEAVGEFRSVARQELVGRRP